jgi:tetratricopeptide (TPR) repeat protein
VDASDGDVFSGRTDGSSWIVNDAADGRMNRQLAKAADNPEGLGGPVIVREPGAALGVQSGGRDEVRRLLEIAERQLHLNGDLRLSRSLYEAGYRAAEQVADWESMAVAAIGSAGFWVHERRDVTSATLLNHRLGSALAMIDQESALGLRVRARLAAEEDYQTGGSSSILALLEEARQLGDSIALADAMSLAHHCLLGPDSSPRRHSLAQELIAGSSRTVRRSDRLMGLLWCVVDLLLDGDRHAERRLTELHEMLDAEGHAAVAYVVHAIDVMLTIRSGRLDDAEARARACADAGAAIGDPDALAWYGGQMLAIRWYQGRGQELLPMLEQMVNSPILSAVDNSYLAALAVTSARKGDRRRASVALAKLVGGGLAELPRSSTWLATMAGVAETAFLLDDQLVLAEAYELLQPFKDLPVMASLAITCFGSLQQILGIAARGLGQLDLAIHHFRAAVRSNLALGHLPAVAWSRARLADALTERSNPDDQVEAETNWKSAESDAAWMGVRLPVAVELESVAKRNNLPGGLRDLVFKRQGRLWRIELGHRTALVEHSIGMTYLSALIGSPGYEISALDLAAGREVAKLMPTESLRVSDQPLLDAQAKREYADRISMLKAEIAEYEANHDLLRAEQARAECDWLVGELTAATGLAGRARNFSGTEERARVSVGKAIRRAIGRIERADATIGNALRTAVQTGLRCCYRPY